MTGEIRTQVRAILAEHGRLTKDATQLADDEDLYRAGLTSHASVTVMLACEDAFDVEFAPEQLKKSTFASVAAIAGALETAGAEPGGVA